MVRVHVRPPVLDTLPAYAPEEITHRFWEFYLRTIGEVHDPRLPFVVSGELVRRRRPVVVIGSVKESVVDARIPFTVINERCELSNVG